MYHKTPIKSVIMYEIVRKEIEEAVVNRDYHIISNIINTNNNTYPYDLYVLKIIYSTAINYEDLQIIDLITDHAHISLDQLSGSKSSILTAYTKHGANFAHELILRGDYIKPDFVIKAIQSKNNSMFDFVTEYNPGKFVFIHALRSCLLNGTNNIEVAEVLFDYVDIEDLQDICTNYVFNIFMYCTFEVFLLLGSKINVNTPEVLYSASYNKNPAIVDYLLQNGVEPSLQTIRTMIKCILTNKDTRERDNNGCYPNPKWARAMFDSLERNNIDLSALIKRTPSEYLYKLENLGVDLYAVINILTDC